MHSSTHRNRHIAFWVEKAAQAIVRARTAHGDDAVNSRIDNAISREDAATTARVLRVLARDLGDKPTDLDALDQRLRAMAGLEAQVALPDEPAPPREPPHGEQEAGQRLVPPTGLKRDMFPRRRNR